MSRMCIAKPDGYWWSGTEQLTAWQTPEFVLGTTKPTASNTGVQPGRILTDVTTDQVYSTPGQVIEDKRFKCFVRVDAANVVFRNCDFQGRSAGFTQYGTIDLRGATVTNCLLEHCTIRNGALTGEASNFDYSRYWLNAVSGKNFTMYRCNIYGGVDGFGINGNNWSIKGCYLHDMTLRVDDNDHATDDRYDLVTHNDLIQVSNCGGTCLIEGCNFEAYLAANLGHWPAALNFTVTDTLGNTALAADEFPERQFCKGIFLGPRSGTITGLHIKKNWFEGGEFFMQLGPQGQGYDSGNSVTFEDNRIVPNQVGYQIFSGGVKSRQTPAYFSMNSSTGTFAGLETTRYADDPRVPVEWRNQLIQAPTGGTVKTYRLTV